MSSSASLTDAEKIERARQSLNLFAFPSPMVADQVGNLLDGLRLLCDSLNDSPPSLWEQANLVDSALVRERARLRLERAHKSVATATMTKERSDHR